MEDRAYAQPPSFYPSFTVESAREA